MLFSVTAMRMQHSQAKMPRFGVQVVQCPVDQPVAQVAEIAVVEAWLKVPLPILVVVAVVVEVEEVAVEGAAVVEEAVVVEEEVVVEVANIEQP